MLIEKCGLWQLTGNVTSAHIHLPGEGIRGDDRTRQNGRKRQRVVERAEAEKGETKSEIERERGEHRGEETDAKRLK